MNVPSYLKGYEKIYKINPRKAATSWFKDARYGLFLHYGLYSLLKRHEWVQYLEKIPVSKYAELASKFTADKFNAEKIADFAVAAGMRYINFTTRHHESFCLFDTKETEFNSINAPCGRDLVGELAVACENRGLGLCLYYSHGRDWKHPHAPNNDNWEGCARPEYSPPEPSYAYGKENDLNKYLDFMKSQITELLTKYGSIASIWLDGIAVPLSGDSIVFRCQELYDHIHKIQPQTLVAYKQGITGTEDYFAPEHAVPSLSSPERQRGKIANERKKLVEVCTTMCPGSWGYMECKKGKHLNEKQVRGKLNEAKKNNYNLLLNMGLLPDGELDPEDELVLLKVADDNIFFS